MIDQGKSYRGPSGIARDSMWLSQEDLPMGKDVPVEIEDVRLFDEVTFGQGREVKNVLALKFKGKDRMLALNATNRRSLMTLSGTNMAGEWVGKTIALFVETGVRRPDGTRGPAVRIRAKEVSAA
jgi:hypothetical protein